MAGADAVHRHPSRKPTAEELAAVIAVVTEAYERGCGRRRRGCAAAVGLEVSARGLRAPAARRGLGRFAG
jgi:hypothetical protein